MRLKPWWLTFAAWQSDGDVFLILLLVAFSIVLIAVFVFRPQSTAGRGVKMIAFLALFALPLLCFGIGASGELEHAKSTQFCLSCHIMEPYGKSLHVDDPQHLPAAHFQGALP